MRKATSLFVAYAGCVVAAGAPVLRAVYALSVADPTASHLLLVPIIAVAVIWRDRDAIFETVGRDLVLGGALIAVGAVLASIVAARGAGMSGDVLSVAAAALVLFLVGGFALFFGRAASRAALFPLLFLVFMIPIPSTVVEAVTAYLKWGSSGVVSLLFTVSGTPYHQDGYVFALPGFAIEIADECSGIRSSISLFLTSLLIGHLALETTWKKVLLAAAVVPLAVVKNGIRIVSLSLLAMHVDPGFLAGRLHHEGGIAFYLLALVFLGPLVAILHRSELSRGAMASARV